MERSKSIDESGPNNTLDTRGIATNAVRLNLSFILRVQS